MKRQTLFLITAAGLCTYCPAVEKELDPKDLPAAVSTAIAKAYPKAEIDETVAHIKKGVTTYEAELETSDGSEIELTLDASGKILTVEQEIEPEKLPAAVSASVAKAYPGAEIEDAEIITENGETTYEVEVSTKGGKEMDITLDASGKVLKSEAEEGDDEDPVHNKKIKK